MIQRIQTLYLALTVILCGLTFVLPMALFKISQPGNNVLYQYNLSGMTNALTKAPIEVKNTLYLQLLVIAIGAASLAAIFLYKNRPLQFNICRLTHLISFLLLGVLYFVIESDIKASYGADNVSVVYLPAGYFPPLIVVVLFLAARGIKKDEDLLKSADRLR